MDQEKGVVESSSPGHDDDEDAPLLLDIRSVDKEIDSLYNPTAHVKRHNTSQDAVSSKPVSVKNDCPEWSLPPPQKDGEGSCVSLSDNMDLPVPEGSTPSTSGQKDIGKHPLMTEEESDSNPPLGKEDGHVSNNADALVTGPPLLTPPLSYVASNSNPEKKSSGNEVVSGDVFGIMLEKLKEAKERVTEGFAEAAASMETSPMAEARRSIVTESQAMRISHLERRHEEECNWLSEKCSRLRKENEELKALVQNQGETEADISAPAAAACGGDSKGQNYELTDAESSSSAVEASPSASLLVAAPVDDCIKCDDIDVMMTKVALAVASCAEIQKAADHLPSVGCVIRGFTLNHLPVYSMGWNGIIANIDKKDLDAVKSCYEPSKKRDRAVAKRYCLHAEVQALNSLPGNVVDASAYITHSPCQDCAKLLCHRGIVRIFYVFWLNGCETSIELFAQQDITCMAFPHRDVILRDFSLEFLKTTGINRGGTDTDKLPGECPSFVSSKDRKQK